MVETDIELPTFYKPTPSRGAPVTVEGIAPPEREGGGESAYVPPAAGVEPERNETYTVQKGDSLWSIAAKPDVYGSATRWRSIFDANRDVLKNPDGIRPGMTLKIPRGHGRSHPAPAQDEGTTFKK
ncbi:MAG: LysM peptidoglycan-binding domain-containing protein [Candidatus Omnitrophica bacterium]|nr:LysM peptidoglycan-binding domain-containing protein [Candidatus Omnitrophota bacterium]MBI3021294.1 LysM peptidoglycan-binding domain-containing protein [Candidatus Omnitrophota bacterium]MBI3083902.1 LysM peptidoglycan-binding domain-containing protein [Candidatus Omnitrophota bacterium]